MPPELFRIEPQFVQRIWGSRTLAPLFPEKANLKEPIGEVWLTGTNCHVATGPFAGKTLAEAWREVPAEWRGEKFKEPGDFPLLLKFIFPQDKLSIQVHPDDAYAERHEKAAGGRGKTEMWHVVSAEPEAQVLIGLKPGVDKAKFLAALETHTVEDLFQAHSARAGDTFFLPAGTPHTIGPGMVICEVQQYSDVTYRVYDYGRVDAQGKPRELHVAKALEVIDFGASKGGKVPRTSLLAGREGRRELARCAYFSAERLDFDRDAHFTFAGPERREHSFHLMVILAGDGIVASLPRRGAGGEIPFRQGECWFVPANAFREGCEFHSNGKVSLLTACVP
ncbi:MAG TPA: type I phosphomannose isomerase catalytic subunit [Candidatus Acidoferrum sp.]|nr:type I phosphomannose isomerase catalytic subunit [Candidatus Acidoferrum sp.]